MNGLWGNNSDVSGLGPMDAIHESRGWFIGLGIALSILGILAIGVPFAASLATTLFIGCLLVIGGVAHAVHAVRNRRWTGSSWAILSSIFYVIAGFFIVINPVVGTATLTLVLAALFIANGVVKIVRAVQHRAAPSWGWLLADGIITLALGALIWARWPSTAIWAIGLLVGVELLISGSSMLMLGLMGRNTVVRARL
jgi:uncharacterized membrane protein HdeD (DUF308 family)